MRIQLLLLIVPLTILNACAHTVTNPDGTTYREPGAFSRIMTGMGDGISGRKVTTCRTIGDTTRCTQ